MVKKRSTFLTLTCNNSNLTSYLKADKAPTSVILKSLRFLVVSKYFNFSYSLKNLRVLSMLIRSQLIKSNINCVPTIKYEFFKKSKFFKNSFSNSFYLDKDYNKQFSLNFTHLESSYVSTQTTDMTFSNNLTDNSSTYYSSKIYNQARLPSLKIDKTIVVRNSHFNYSLHRILNLIAYSSKLIN